MHAHIPADKTRNVLKYKVYCLIVSVGEISEIQLVF